VEALEFIEKGNALLFFLSTVKQKHKSWQEFLFIDDIHCRAKSL
jgi:hypothetical protein